MGSGHSFQIRDLKPIKLVGQDLELLEVAGFKVLRAAKRLNSREEQQLFAAKAKSRMLSCQQLGVTYGLTLQSIQGMPSVSIYYEWDSTVADQIQRRKGSRNHFTQQEIWKLVEVIVTFVKTPLPLDPLPNIGSRTLLFYRLKVVDTWLLMTHPHFKNQTPPSYQILKTILEIMSLKQLSTINRAIFDMVVSDVGHLYSEELLGFIKALSQGRIDPIPRVRKLMAQPNPEVKQKGILPGQPLRLNFQSKLYQPKMGQSKLHHNKLSEFKIEVRERAKQFDSHFKQAEIKSLERTIQSRDSPQPCLIRKNIPRKLATHTAYQFFGQHKSQPKETTSRLVQTQKQKQPQWPRNTAYQRQSIFQEKPKKRHMHYLMKQGQSPPTTPRQIKSFFVPLKKQIQVSKQESGYTVQTEVHFKRPEKSPSRMAQMPVVSKNHHQDKAKKIAMHQNARVYLSGDSQAAQSYQSKKIGSFLSIDRVERQSRQKFKTGLSSQYISTKREVQSREKKYFNQVKPRADSQKVKENAMAKEAGEPGKRPRRMETEGGAEQTKPEASLPNGMRLYAKNLFGQKENKRQND